MQDDNKTQTCGKTDIKLLNLGVTWQRILCQQQHNRPDRSSIVWGADIGKQKILVPWLQGPLAGCSVVRLGVVPQLWRLAGLRELWAVQHDPSRRPPRPRHHRLDRAPQVRLQRLQSVTVCGSRLKNTDCYLGLHCLWLESTVPCFNVEFKDD